MSADSDSLANLSAEVCVLYGGSTAASIAPSDLILIMSAFPEGCFSENLKKEVFKAAKLDVSSGLDAGQLVRLCRALEQTSSIPTVSLLEGVCYAAYHRVFVAVDEAGNGFLDESSVRLVLEAFGASSSQIAGVRATGVRDNIFADEIGKLVRLAIGTNLSKQNSIAKALQYIQEKNQSPIAGTGRARGASRSTASSPSGVNVIQASTDPTVADLATMLDLKNNGGVNMKDVADAVYASLPKVDEKVTSVLNRTIDLAQGALLDEVALNTFLEHHFAQYVPGMSKRALIRALIDATCPKFLAVAGCLETAGKGALTTGGTSGGMQDTRHRPLALTPYLEALGFSRSQISSSYTSSVSVNDALRRIFKQHQSKQAGAMKIFISHRSKVQARAGPRSNPPVPGSDEETKLFEEVFGLLDSRGLNALNLDNVMEFLEPVPHGPDPSIVNKLFDQVDAEGGGNLDRAGFRALCVELEKMRILSFGGLLQCFREYAHRKMFEIADKDGGGTIDKGELRMVMECIGASSTEIAKATQNMPNELSLDEFSQVISPFSRGKSLSQIVETGSRMQKSASSTKSAMKMFQNVAKAATGPKGGIAAVLAQAAEGAPKLASVVAAAAETGVGGHQDKKMCYNCSELDGTITHLTAQIESLKLDLSKSEYANDNGRSGSADSGSDSRGNSAPAEVIDDMLRGDLYRGMRAFENIPAATYYKKYPQLSKSFMFKAASTRVQQVMQSMMSNSRSALSAAHDFTNAHKKKVEDLMEQLTVDIEMIHENIKEFFEISQDLVERLANSTTIDKEKIQNRGVDLNLARQKVQGMSSDLEWISEKVIAWSEEAIDLAVVAAPFSSRISDVLNNVLYLDTSTVSLVEMLCLCNFIASGQPVDAEVWARRVLSGTHVCIPEDAVPGLKSFNDTAMTRLGSFSAWERHRNDYRKAFTALHKALSRSTAMKKDKAVFTQGNASYAYSLRALNKREGGMSKGRSGGGSGGSAPGAKSDPMQNPDHPGFTAMGEESVTVLTPRTRHRRPEITDPVKYVDRLLQDLQEREPDLPIPADFRRIDPNVNTFWFNERIIDLIPNDTQCVVKVGGGYVMFEEYCSKYGRAGANDGTFTAMGTLGVSAGSNAADGGPQHHHHHQMGSTPRTGRSTMGGMTPRGAMTAGSASPNNSQSPRSGGATPRRVLVRQGRGVVLH